ncbi:helix-turn-helix transcriptional regulator [Amycolatopsis tolypomycina]|uniref:helix-turn-helix transcriptional regulator n=1 Tax=Amycolatopsis tolypomycina TaxID=208445 RepID=UPI00339F6209
MKRPTLDEIRLWPPTVRVPKAAPAFGISRSHGYKLARSGQFPAKVLQVGDRLLVVTSSIIEALSNSADFTTTQRPTESTEMRQQENI